MSTFEPNAQAELVGKLVRGARNGRSMCHQMLMGEGKTTVVAPLLGLLLADGSQVSAVSSVSHEHFSVSTLTRA